jgi:hypothetical protein
MAVGKTVLAAILFASAAAGSCKGSQALVFESVNPASGRLGGGEEVRIRGSGFEKLGNLEVRLGGRPATNVGVQGDDTIVLTTPEGREADADHPVDVSLLTSEGKSIILRRVFTYQAGASPHGAGGPHEDLRRRL